MRDRDVPQDHNKTLDGERKLVYAIGDDGRYRGIPSYGWKVEETVTTLAVKQFERRARAAQARVREGRSSPLEYHMYRHRMDVLTLAQSVGMTRWRVRRHLKPRPFARLSSQVMERYAETLGISVAELRTVD